MISEDDNQAILNLVNDMKTKLGNNTHKRHYSNQSLTYLFERLDEELSELKEEINSLINANISLLMLPEDKETWDYHYAAAATHIQMECADIANFAMMIHASVRTNKTKEEYTKIR